MNPAEIENQSQSTSAAEGGRNYLQTEGRKSRKVNSQKLNRYRELMRKYHGIDQVVTLFESHDQRLSAWNTVATVNKFKSNSYFANNPDVAKAFATDYIKIAHNPESPLQLKHIHDYFYCRFEMGENIVSNAILGRILTDSANWFHLLERKDKLEFLIYEIGEMNAAYSNTTRKRNRTAGFLEKLHSYLEIALALKEEEDEYDSFFQEANGLFLTIKSDLESAPRQTKRRKSKDTTHDEASSSRSRTEGVSFEGDNGPVEIDEIDRDMANFLIPEGVLEDDTEHPHKGVPWYYDAGETEIREWINNIPTRTYSDDQLSQLIKKICEESNQELVAVWLLQHSVPLTAHNSRLDHSAIPETQRPFPRYLKEKIMYNTMCNDI